MKIKVILESQLSEIDHEFRRDDPRDDYRDYDYDDDKLEDFLKIKWQEDYISVYDALDGVLGDGNWAEKVNSWFESDIEDLSFNEKDLDKFREMAVGATGANRKSIEQAVDKYVVADDFWSWRKTDDVEQYVEMYHDQHAQKDDIRRLR